LYIAFDLNYISKSEFDATYEDSVNIITQISNFKNYLNKYILNEKLKTVKIFILQIISMN